MPFVSYERQKNRVKTPVLEAYVTVQICCCCVQVAQHPSNMLVYLRDGSAQTMVPATTLRYKLQITFYLTSSQYTNTCPASPSATCVTPGPRQGSHWITFFFKVTGMIRPRKRAKLIAGIEPRSVALDALATYPTRRHLA